MNGVLLDLHRIEFSLDEMRLAQPDLFIVSWIGFGTGCILVGMLTPTH